MQEERIGGARSVSDVSNVGIESIVGNVGREEIAEELFAAIKEYFIGKFDLMGSQISLELLSGEHFIVSVT